jgi:calicheamicin 4-deoxy-4-thio-alpha-D-digitoxosyltransferase
VVICRVPKRANEIPRARAPLHVAVFTIPTYGHVTPTLAVVAELVRRGHRVSYFTTAEFADSVAATGATVCAYPSTWAGSTSPTERVSTDDAAWGALGFLREGLAPVEVAERRLSEDRPDVILYDMIAYATARMLGRRWNVPTVQMYPTFASSDRFALTDELAKHAGGLDLGHPAMLEMKDVMLAALAAHGDGAVSPTDLYLGNRDVARLVFLPRSFQLAARTFDRRYTFVGPCLGERAWSGEWSPPADGRPVLLVSLGTAFNHQPAFFRTCLDAFADSPWHVVMAIGRQIEPAELGPVPANAEVHQWMPQLAVLRHAAVFVTHAGMGSTMESLHFGVPLVAVPQMAEQDAVARRIVELGLGRMIPPDDVTAEGLREAVDAVAADAGTARRVADLRAEIDGSGGPVRAAEVVERAARSAGARRGPFRWMIGR